MDFLRIHKLCMGNDMKFSGQNVAEFLPIDSMASALMKKAFILQFEEGVEQSDGSAVTNGTFTTTRQNLEGGDADPGPERHAVLRKIAIENGTTTKTAVRMEHSDADAGAESLTALKKCSFRNSGTGTATFVATEAADRDVAERAHGMLPRCF